MSISTIRTHIKTTLEGVTDIGIVNDYFRRVNEWSKIETLFKQNDKIDTWIIKYMGSTFEFDETIEGFDADRTFEIWGLYSLNDTNATEKTFDNIVENVEDTFANLRVLSDGLYKIDDMTTVMDEYEFAGILCNRCVFTLKIKELQIYD